VDEHNGSDVITKGLVGITGGAREHDVHDDAAPALGHYLSKRVIENGECEKYCTHNFALKH
jgi:hypothetical protein